MSANSSNRQPDQPQPSRMQRRYRLGVAFALPVWVVIGFGAAQVLLFALLYVLQWFGVSFESIDKTVFNAVVTACVYTLTVGLVVSLPWCINKYRTTKEDIGLRRLPSWMDISLAPAGFVIYFLSSALLVYVIELLVPGFDLNQLQDTGFKGITHDYEYVLAFATLIVIAPIAEEVLFRGYLYGKLRKVVPMWAAMFITSILFGAVHGQWNVAIDVFALSMVLCSLREVTGNIWAGILLHMFKNSLAFYILFINPALLHTIGG